MYNPHSGRANVKLIGSSYWTYPYRIPTSPLLDHCNVTNHQLCPLAHNQYAAFAATPHNAVTISFAARMTLASKTPQDPKRVRIDLRSVLTTPQMLMSPVSSTISTNAPATNQTVLSLAPHPPGSLRNLIEKPNLKLANRHHPTGAFPIPSYKVPPPQCVLQTGQTLPHRK